VADENGPMLEGKKELKQVGSLGQRKASPPMELGKEVAVKVGKLSLYHSVRQVCFVLIKL